MFFYGNAKTYSEHRAYISRLDRASLEADILNRHYNEFAKEFCDYKSGEARPNGVGKRIPYIGWFWRELDFYNLIRIPIGNCGVFIGFMANNKWGYSQRYLTEAEALRVIAFFDAAIEASKNYGINQGEREKAVDFQLNELWNYMQTLDLQFLENGDDEREP